jgi:hypothetical protein
MYPRREPTAKPVHIGDDYRANGASAVTLSQLDLAGDAEISGAPFELRGNRARGAVARDGAEAGRAIGGSLA